jgi:hypothetical protein
MKTIRKILIIIFFGFVLRTLSSCFNCDCDDEALYFDFTRVELTNLDNSQTYAIPTQSDTMISKAVAFDVKIVNDNLFSFRNVPENLFSFSSAYAWSCDCPQLFRANNKIEKISLITVFNINANINANSDITDRFVAHKENYYQPTGLYLTINELYSKINPDTYNDRAVEEFKLYLKDEVENEKAQFIINVHLINGIVLSDTSKILTIKNL